MRMRSEQDLKLTQHIGFVCIASVDVMYCIYLGNDWARSDVVSTICIHSSQSFIVIEE